MNLSVKKPILFASMLLLSAVAMAQKEEGYRWQVGINWGLMVYQGDLTPSSFGSYKTATPTLSVYVSRILNPYFAIRANAVFGVLQGDEAKYSSPLWRKHRAFSFSSPATELSALFVWNPYGNNSDEVGLKFTPYLLGGAGVNFLNIKRDYSKIDSVVFPASTKQRQGLAIDTLYTPPGSILVLPVGAGVAYKINSKFSLTFETIFRYTFTDYLDGFSHAADERQKDFYHTHTLGIIYKFGRKNQLDCPPMKY